MKKETILLVLFSVIIVVIGVISNLPKSNHMITRPQLSPGEYMAHQRMYPYDEIKTDVYFEAMKQIKEFKSSSAKKDYEWIFAGPPDTGGRITDIEMHPDSPETIYVGAATGGVWKSVDDGENWEYSFEGVVLISIGDIAIDPNDENTLYVGTGEANNQASSFRGDGIYKSTDAGLTWEFSGLPYSAYFGRIIVDYDNSNRIFAAACGNLFTPDADRGLYRSLDGGDTWENILFVNDSTSAIDIVQHPTDPDILYAAMWERMKGLSYRHSFGEGSGIYKTEDGGDTWIELTNGLITDDRKGRIGLTISQSNPDILYAYYDLPDNSVALFKTEDGGTSWTQTNDGGLQGITNSFGWYFGQVRVHPEDEDRVWVMGVEMYTTTSGGNSWFWATGGVHVDQHAMYFDQVNDRILLGNDGGLYESNNMGNDWNKINNLPITQFYALDIDYQDPDRLIGGTQDNGTIMNYDGGFYNWQKILGGDGMYCLIDYTNSDVIYAEYQNGNLFKATNGWTMNYISWWWEDDRRNWSAPLAMDPVNPETLYFGTYRIWKSTDEGDSWLPYSEDLTNGVDQYFHTVTTIAVHPLDPDIVIAGTGDGFVHISTDEGFVWEDVTNELPDRWITRVIGDPFDENTIYVTVSGFRWDEPLAHVFKSTDLGQNWTSISGDLPEIPVNDIVLDPEFPGVIYIGTDAGVFFTDNGGESWISLNEGIHNVPVMAMKIHNPSRQLVIGTYGLSMFKLNMDDLISSVPEISDSKVTFSLYPNPASQQIKITSNENIQGSKWEISDVNGKFLKQGFINDESILIAAFPSGVYFMSLEGANGRVVKKWIKQ